MDPMTIGAGMGLLGALAGSQGQQSSQTYTKDVGQAGAYEKQGLKAQGNSLTAFEDLVNYGPGQAQVKAGLQSQQDLASMLQKMLSGGGLPNQQQMGYANQFTNDVFAPEQMALGQRFEDAQTVANRQAARMGRGGNDPILMNKLLQEQTRQQQMLGSQMTQYRSQFAQQLPQQMLGMQSQLAQVNSGLASQAMANRQALFSLGSNLSQQQQNFRLGAATSTQSTTSGGGLAGALTGGLAGFSSGFGAGNMLSKATLPAGGNYAGGDGGLSMLQSRGPGVQMVNGL